MIIGYDIKNPEKAIELSTDKSRVALIAGKRGGGKSYTMGVFAEELFLLTKHGTTSRLLLLIDPLGIFYTFCQRNPDTTGDNSVSIPVKLHVPGDPEKRYGTDVMACMEAMGVRFHSLRLPPSAISPDGWCDLFDFNINEPLGIALFRAVQSFRPHFFTLAQLIERVMEDAQSQDKTKEALINRLEMAGNWDIFSTSEEDVLAQLDPHAINVLDLSVLDPGSHGRANLIVSVVCRILFLNRVKAKRRENFGLAPSQERVWLLVDEAHRLVPSGRTTLAKDILISWVKEGRQPGLSAVFATQQPSALDSEILSQCDFVLCHRLTNQVDIAAVNRLSHDYLGNELKTFLRHIKQPGEALLLDDFSESLSILKVKPRSTLHGGGE